MFRKINKDPRILELNIGTELEDGIVVSDYDLRLLKDYGIVDLEVDVDEKIYSVYKELYEKAYNPSIIIYNDRTYIRITEQKYLRHKPKYKYLIAFSWDIDEHLKAAIATKLNLLIYHNNKFLLILPQML